MHSKWFSACSFFTFSCDNPISQMAWDGKLNDLRHRPIGEAQKESYGFSSPFGYLAPKVMSHEMQSVMYFSITHEKKSIPRNKLNRLFMQKLEEKAKRENINVSDIKGAERKSLKEATELELLKKTVPDEVYINFMIDMQAKTLFFEGSNQSAIGIMEKLLQKVDPSIKIKPFFEASLEIYLTQWVYDPNMNLPRPLVLDHDATLLDEAKSRATFSNQDLESDELINLIKHDKKVTELGVNYDGRVSFKLNNKGIMKRIKPQDVLLSDVGKGQEITSALDDREAHWLMMTGTLAEILQWFAGVFQVNSQGGASTDLATDDAETPHANETIATPALQNTYDPDTEAEEMRELADAMAI